MNIKNTLANIRDMHRGIANIFRDKERKCYEYLDDFLEEVSKFIKNLEIFSHHMIWECITQRVPENTRIEEEYILRDATQKEYRHAPIQKSDSFNYPRDEYLRVPLKKQDFSEKFNGYFRGGTLEKVFDIPLESDYSYFNLPVFSENKRMPQWILTLIYKIEDSDLVESENFFDLMEHLSQQIGLAWDKFRESIANKLLRNIDNRLALMEKTRSDSFIDQLKEISMILAREINLAWCGFFLVNEQENKLKLEISNIDLEFPLDYSLSDSSNIMVNCFNKNRGLSLFGRKSLKEIVKDDKMEAIERGIRAKRNKKMFEHALFFPIAVVEKQKGLMVLFRAKDTQEPEPQDRFANVTRPFSEFEIHLLRKVRRYVLYIFIFHETVQKRMSDTRNIITQVISPISALISASGHHIKGSAAAGNVSEKLRDVYALSRIADHYVKNFEILLDIDTGGINLNKERITDLRKYLIRSAILYTPLIRPKCISINVTRQTPSSISLEVDKDLFDVVISNIIDNAIKYSFDPEDRLLHGLQAKPSSTEDKENVLITAKEDEQSVVIMVSSYGIELKEPEWEKAFDRDFRGDMAEDRASGTGIGLYVAKEIIEKHGGTIGIVPDTSEYNTMFKITLPKTRRVG